MNKLRVAVLMGGKSIEREVSFNSGRTVCDHLDPECYEIIPFFQQKDGTLFILPWHFLHRGKIADFEQRLSKEAESIAWDDLKKWVDFVYIATHGRYAEDGTLQGMLEVLGIPYLGSKLYASAIGMDKIIQKKVLAMHGIDTPRGIVIEAHHATQPTKKDIESINEQLQKEQINFPVIVKPHKEGSSLGISIVKKCSELKQALITAATIHPRQEQAVLIEEKIEGMEFSCITLIDYKMGAFHPLAPTEVVADSAIELFDYEQKYMPGRAIEYTPARCSKKILKAIQDTCIKATQALEMCTISRIDGFVTKDGRIIVIDPNTLSGMAPASFLFREAAQENMSHTHVINHLIETELHQYGMLNAVIQQEKREQKMTQQKTRVAVLLGGASNEKEISLESGRNVTYKLSPQKYESIPLFASSKMELYKIPQSLLVRNSTSEIESLVTPEMKVTWQELPDLADFIFIGLHGGAGENGAVQGALEMLGLPYNGSSVLASSMCMDKYKTNEFLRHHGFEVPKSLLIARTDWETTPKETQKKIMNELPLPVIIKPHDDGCSMMVEKISTEKQIATALNAIFADKKSHALVEECIDGMELTVGVIGNEKPRALPPSQAVTTGDILSIEEKFLPGAGENQTPAPLSPHATKLVQQTVERAYKAVSCSGYARIDCFYQTREQSPTGKERVILLEFNTLPGMTPATCIFHQAAEIGIKPMEFIDSIIQLGFEKHHY